MRGHLHVVSFKGTVKARNLTSYIHAVQLGNGLEPIRAFRLCRACELSSIREML